jgi:hypothetical protein
MLRSQRGCLRATSDKQEVDRSCHHRLERHAEVTFVAGLTKQSGTGVRTGHDVVLEEADCSILLARSSMFLGLAKTTLCSSGTPGGRA